MNDLFNHLGNKRRDKVSGFTGTCTAVVAYYHGDAQIEITANEISRDGDVVSKWFNTSRVEELT